MYVCMCSCVHTHVEAREQPWMLFLGFEPFPFVFESFPGLELTRWARLKISKPQESLAIPLHTDCRHAWLCFFKCSGGGLNSDPCPCKANTVT